jgi:hypothetical protein
LFWLNFRPYSPRKNSFIPYLRKINQHIALAFAVLIAVNSIGFIISFSVLRHDWRQTVRQHLATWTQNKDLTVFHFSNQDIHANEDEFSFNGSFYDAVKREIRGDSVIVYCFLDEKETELTASFAQNIQELSAKNNDFQGKTKHIFDFLLKDLYFSKNTFDLATPSVFFMQNRISNDLHHIYTSPSLDFLSPPPQV